MKKLFALGLMLTILTVAVSAQTTRERIKRDRIREGVRSGQITRSERLELRKDQFRYKNMQRRAHRDGVVTRSERKRLQNQRVQDRRDQFRFKYNRQRRVLN